MNRLLEATRGVFHHHLMSIAGNQSYSVKRIEYAIVTNKLLLNI